ncbi:MAG: ornithine cyclodeaminase family protein, partial [Anaerolineae bacterium]|nr:ornithine cyclodeaminase family protein [Anaerolineae bacterium]
NGYLTNIKVGAAGALAADYLANHQISKVAVIGASKQAFMQLKSLTAVRQIESVWVWDASPLKADNYVRHMVEDHDLNIRIAPAAQAAVEQADLVIAAAESEQPVINAAWLKPGVHITSTALDHQPVKQNLEPEIWQRADLIVVDSLKQCIQMGELYHAQRAGVIRYSDIQGDLSDLISGRTRGRTQADQITLADITGLGSHDTALATLALEKALFLGLGQRLEVGLPSQGFGVGVGNLL